MWCESVTFDSLASPQAGWSQTTSRDSWGCTDDPLCRALSRLGCPASDYQRRRRGVISLLFVYCEILVAFHPSLTPALSRVRECRVLANVVTSLFVGGFGGGQEEDEGTVTSPKYVPIKEACRRPSTVRIAVFLTAGHQWRRWCCRKVSSRSFGHWSRISASRQPERDGVSTKAGLGLQLTRSLR